jgi:hypothetical protein
MSFPSSLRIPILGITVRTGPRGFLPEPLPSDLLGDLILYMRAHKITQRDLALAAGVDESLISRALMGERRFTEERIKRIRSRYPQMPARLFKMAA